MQWNITTGMPTKIRSKWGDGEVIISDRLNPFEGSYGTAVAYFK